MKNLKIMSFDLDKKFIFNKSRRNHITIDFIEEEKCDIVLLQGVEQSYHDICFARLPYRIFYSKGYKTLTLIHQDLNCWILNFKQIDQLGSVLVFHDNCDKKNLALINIKTSKKQDLNIIKDIYKLYTNKDTNEYVDNLIIAGTFPRNLDIDKFSNDLNLKDISSGVGQSFYHGRKPLNHMFLSDKIIEGETFKQIGIVDQLKVSDHYPIITSCTYKKVKS